MSVEVTDFHRNIVVADDIARTIEIQAPGTQGPAGGVQGANVTAANNLNLGTVGNVFTIGGNTQINAIVSTGFQNGQNVVLKFTGTPKVKHNTAGGTGTAIVLLNGSADFDAVDDAILGLVLIDGEWHETFRKVP